MPALPLTTANYGRPRVGMPTTRLVNAYIEGSKGGPTQAVRLPRPGLQPLYSVGLGPILRQFQQPGFLNGDLFTISGGELYRNQDLIGEVAYSNQPRMAATGHTNADAQLAIVSGGLLYIYNGTTLTQVTTFDDDVSPLPSFSGVAVLYDIFVYPVTGSDTFFFSTVNNAASINAANLSVAQTSPDPIVEVAVLAEELLFFGTDSMEFWDYTGVLTAPFALSQGRTYIRGAASQGSVVKLDNAMFWVGDDLTVYRSSAVPARVSTPFIDDRMRVAGAGASDFTAFGIYVEGHVFYVINLPLINESYAYDCQTQEWAQWGTQQPYMTEPGIFAASTSVGRGETIYLGSASSGDIWLLDPARNTDGIIVKRIVVSGALWMVGGMQRCNNVSLSCVRGVGDSAAPNPFVQMRFSDDGGRTFTSWLDADIGQMGQYYYKPTWRYLGIMQQPGRLFEFAVSDPVNFSVEGATVNEARV